METRTIEDPVMGILTLEESFGRDGNVIYFSWDGTLETTAFGTIGLVLSEFPEEHFAEAREIVKEFIAKQHELRQRSDEAIKVQCNELTSGYHPGHGYTQERILNALKEEEPCLTIGWDEYEETFEAISIILSYPDICDIEHGMAVRFRSSPRDWSVTECDLAAHVL